MVGAKSWKEFRKIWEKAEGPEGNYYLPLEIEEEILPKSSNFGETVYSVGYIGTEGESGSYPVASGIETLVEMLKPSATFLSLIGEEEYALYSFPGVDFVKVDIPGMTDFFVIKYL